MLIKTSCTIIMPLFLCFNIITLTGCTEAIVTQEQSTNHTSTIPKNEIVRVIIDRSILSQNPFENYNWNYNTQAKIKTEEILSHLGYTVVDTGLSPNNNGKPTIIAVVNAQKDSIKKNKIHYSMNLYKPLSTNNSLFICDKNQQNSNLCISPPTIENAKQLFQTNCTYSGTANVASFIMQYCVKSAFFTYPQGSNKRIIYTTSEQPLVKDLDQQK